MTSDQGITARQASFGGVWSRVLLRWCAVSCWLAVVGFTVMAFTVDMPVWTIVIIEATMLLIVLPLGFAIWSDAAEHKVDTERLLRNGRPAVAEVVELERTDVGDEGGEVLVLSLRISGDDVPPFEATYRGRPDRAFRVGARLYATVVPADYLFSLGHL